MNNLFIMKRWKLLIALLLFAIALVFIIIIQSSETSNEDNKRLEFSRKTQREKALANMDILAHPEKYPISDFIPTEHTPSNTTHNDDGQNIDAQYSASDDWKEVTSRIFVHSAYEDPRQRPNRTVIVRIISIIHKDELTNLKLRCKLKNNNATRYSDNEYSAVSVLQEQHNSTYLSVYFFCFSKDAIMPSHVALEEESSNKTIQWLKFHRKETKKIKGNSINVCVRPFFGPYTNLQLLAEFLAFYDAVGVSSFTFYDYAISDTVRTYLKFVSKEHLNIKLIKWNLPSSVAHLTWQYGQIAGIQDCVLRNGNHKFVLLVDVDEFLVPRQHFTLTELMDDLSKRSKRKIGSYIFRQSFFCSSNRTSISRNHFPLVTTDRIMREEKVWPSKERSKVMVRPETVMEGGIHFVWKHLKGWNSAPVPWELAMIHHYNDEGCYKNSSSLQEDRTAESFKYEIIYAKPMVRWRKLVGL